MLVFGHPSMGGIDGLFASPSTLGVWVKKGKKIKITVFGSGSSGNSILVEGQSGSLLIDAGFSFKELKRRFSTAGKSIDDIDAVLISHEHSDHIKGLRPLSKSVNVPVHMSSGIAGEQHFNGVGPIHEFDAGASFSVKGFEVIPFSVPHDSIDPVGFVIMEGDEKFGIATDCGTVTSLVKQRLTCCNQLMLEFNYDRQMLVDGPYPWFLKQRVMGKNGHLSNDESAMLLADLLHDRLTDIFLAHVSRTNNNYQIPLEAAKRTVAGRSGARLHICKQDLPVF